MPTPPSDDLSSTKLINLTKMARTTSSKKQPPEEDDAPGMAPADSSDDDGSNNSSSGSSEEEEEYDSAAEDEDANSNDDPQVSDDYYNSEDEEEDEFEEQGSSDDDDDLLNGKDDDGEEEESDDEDVEILDEIDVANMDGPRSWPKAMKKKRGVDGKDKNSNIMGGATNASGKQGGDATKKHPSTTTLDEAATAQYMHTDNLSSDDEDDDGTNNRIGRVPLHWYDDYSHIGYDAHGNQVIKSSSSSNNKDLLDQALDAENSLQTKNKFTVYDELNARDVTLTPRQIELIRRLQSGAYAHPEHNANPDYIDYYSGVNPELSGLNSNKYEKKTRFQPSKWEKLQVRRLLHRLKCGSINMDYLEGKVRDMNDLVKRTNEDGEEDGSDKPFQLWKGDEEDELALRKGPQHMPAPKVPPPGHAYSYNPPEEYLPNEDELKEWSEMDPSDRPYGHFIPTKYNNLRSVGAYEHSVKERFERCLDLYLCPRAMKRRLNIDPESLVPQLPKASDLRPFPTSKVIRYVVPTGQEDDDEESKSKSVVVVRCLSVSPDGQFMASGSEDGIVRLWEVQTGRLLKSWDLMTSVVDLVGDEKKDDDDDDKQVSTFY